MIVDCHVHVCATTPGHGTVSRQLADGLLFRFMRWRLGLPGGYGEELERAVEAKLLEAIHTAAPLDAAVVLAFDAVYDREGQYDAARTHLYVTNDYAAELARKDPRVFFVASVHPYRKDAVAELERCVRLGAVLVKWLPIVQDFDPADERCLPFYEALAHHDIPLLCHTGGELSLPNLNKAVADPALLIPALKRGVRVIAAHCGTKGHFRDTDYLPTFVRLAHDYEHLYGDTAALNLPARSYAYATILNDEVVRRKLVHGSDWPIMPLPPLKTGLWNAARLVWREGNWLRRDLEIKQKLGFDAEYWQRAAKVLRLPRL